MIWAGLIFRRAIDLGKFLQLAGMRRPFYCERIRFELERFRQVAFEGPAVNGLAAFLFYRSERNPISPPARSQALLQIRSAREQIFAGTRPAFGNRPGWDGQASRNGKGR